jgi:hypothetical protein
MARIDELKPDQRAALQLLLQQGRSYEDIASLLRIDESAVRERAHAALDALGPEDVADLSLAQQDEIADYLLGQQSASQRASTRDLLERSAPARAWARVVAAEIRPLAGDNLPEIPSEAAEVDEAFDALDRRTEHRERVERSSRVGGAILIAAAVIALFGLVWLGISVLSGDDDEGESASGGTTATQTQPGGNDRVRFERQINLLPPEGQESDLAGAALVASQGNRRVVQLLAQGFPRARESGPFYAIWLYSNQDKAKRLGFPPQPGRNGRIQTQFFLPRDADDYEQLVITRETEQSPDRPGTILIAGPVEGVPVQDQPGQTGTTTSP